MKYFVLIITLATILVSCNFNAQRKLEIKHRIHELELRIEKRSTEEIRVEKLLDAAITEHQNNSIEMKKSDVGWIKHFFEISDRLIELQNQDAADQAEIDQLRKEDSTL